VEQCEHAEGEQDDAGERVVQHGQRVRVVRRADLAQRVQHAEQQQDRDEQRGQQAAGAEQRPQERLGADRTLRLTAPLG
jgi:hypothetical protein